LFSHIIKNIVNREIPMRAIVLAAIGFAICTHPVSAQNRTHVDGFTRKDGTYVEPHYRTNPDNNLNNNWSTKGNTNPYTGEDGKVDPYKSGLSNGLGSGLSGSSRKSGYR
jgi:hypothetical protein